MKIESLHLNNLHNEEHFQFQTGFKGLVEDNGPGALNIAEAFAAYAPLYDDENKALDQVIKSSITDDLAKADTGRDFIFRGFSDAVKSTSRHFRADMRQASARVQVVLDRYGNLTVKPYNEETAAINSLAGDLLTTCVADIELLGLIDWVNELKASNDAFDNLKKSRFTEEAGKTMLQMKVVRAQVDKTYDAIIERINAQITLNGEGTFAGFVRELNSRIAEYSDILAQRKGRNAKGKANDNGAKA